MQGSPDNTRVPQFWPSAPRRPWKSRLGEACLHQPLLPLHAAPRHQTRHSRTPRTCFLMSVLCAFFFVVDVDVQRPGRRGPLNFVITTESIMSYSPRMVRPASGHGRYNSVDESSMHVGSVGSASSGMPSPAGMSLGRSHSSSLSGIRYAICSYCNLVSSLACQAHTAPALYTAPRQVRPHPPPLEGQYNPPQMLPQPGAVATLCSPS